MKKGILICGLFVIAAFSTAKAQLGYNYPKIDIGGGLSRNVAYTDAETLKSTLAIHANVGYNISPFTNLIAEYQRGKFRGGDAVNTLSGREFTNQFNSLAIRLQFQAGEFMNYQKNAVFNALKNVYVGGGIGVMANNITQINRQSIQITDYEYITPGKDKSTELFVPVRIGYEIKLYNEYDEPRVKFDIGYQHNFMLDDNLDGFTAGIANDTFSQIFIGVKFGIGGGTSYRKAIAFE
ncbi:MAG: outer membrane beta-barrel protein [Mucilaginibacter polytrichastri]|nr:outer membrane beta-barrel protein [Mucilaginibacter polytrichastri]